VVWTSGEFVGCRFVRALSPAIVSAAALRSEPSPAADAEDPVPAVESFASRLRRLRKQYGLTQPALARLVDVTKLTVWKWERGDAKPRHTAVQALARVFAMSESELLVGSTAREVEPSAELSSIVESCKAQIARHLGVAPAKVGISVRL
jgi:transcriptional regulator with XRE-family HTH domain